MPESRQVPPPCEFPLERLLLKLDGLVRSDVKVVDEVVDTLRRLLQTAGCGEDLERTELATHEALTNAIIHGNRSSAGKWVRICLALQEDCGLRIQVKDVGAGFDPSGLASPLEEANLLRESGRGIFLIRQLMDDVQFQFEDGTEISMQRNFKKDPKALPSDAPSL